MAEIVKILSVINLNGKYSWAISNGDVDTAKNLYLTNIKKYQRYNS